MSQGWGLPPRVEEGQVGPPPKPSKTPGGPLAFRPIYLLDEAGQMLERVIVDRLIQHLSSDGPDFHDRQDLAYPVQGGVIGWQIMERGVPQGSVLGLLLWDIAFDRGPGPSGQKGGSGLGQTHADPGGPGWHARRLYVGVILSVAVYGAPIWATQLLATAQGRNLRQALRPVVVRAIRGYRSVSYMAATTLAGSPPVELLAEERCFLYWRTKELRERGQETAGGVAALTSQAAARTLQRWADTMSAPREFG
ncbi:uncharacterized protein LOC112588651 [Harpegnathos saltator]|uniref:uncharacterized protein LOC112588651 n=1 Tax=Harpegnathos saltator TaxID=610380 RepID=UPI000DBED81A|nr:uncharacterized protein LOC112588651 [Harpegnathos saltator]